MLTGSRYWKNWGNANQVWMLPTRLRAATSYLRVSSFSDSGVAGSWIVSGRSIVSVPRSSVAQSLNTSRTIIVLAPGSAT